MAPQPDDSDQGTMVRATVRTSATIRDVAAKAGVSVATVSRHLNGTAVLDPKTAKKVGEAMKALDYLPWTSARNLATRSTRTLGLITEHIAGEFFLPLLTGMEHQASDSGYALVISSTEHWSRRKNLPPPLGPHTCDGAVIFPHSLSDTMLAQWHRLHFPMVLIQHDRPEFPGLPSVGVENREPARDAVLHLARVHGRKKILFLAGPEGHQDAEARFEGYRQGLTEAGLPFDPALVVPGEFNEDVGHDSVLKAWDAGVTFDAVFACDDDSALGALGALEERNARPPGTIPVIGFDGSLLGRRQSPPLSTVWAPTYEVGKEAVRCLVELLEGREIPRLTTLSTTLHFSGSCGCP